MSNYHAYLIRLWREDELAAWRGELVSPHTGEQRLFATVEQLLTFLSDQVANEATAEQDDGGRPTTDRRAGAESLSAVGGRRSN
jgi:hypothetical protein